MKGLQRLEKSTKGLALRPIYLGMPQEFPEQSLVSDVLEDLREMD
jgi:hypothetical protein